MALRYFAYIRGNGAGGWGVWVNLGGASDDNNIAAVFVAVEVERDLGIGGDVL